MYKWIIAGTALLLACGCRQPEKTYDTIIRQGMVYDGSGAPGLIADVAIQGDTIAAIGDLAKAKGKVEINAQGKAVAPGFINMLSWATTSLIEDGRSQSDIRQGVTLEVFGEGWSEGPLTPEMKQQVEAQQGDIKYKVEWNTLGEYLQYLEQKGVSCNIASFVGATTLRMTQVGEDDRDPAPEQLAAMQQLVRQAMEEGAMGIGSSLIYAPAFYAETPELIALCQTAAEYGGMYITHMRSEGERLLEAVDEVLDIAKSAGIRAEIYHLKAGGSSNWPKMDQVIAKIDSARAAGLEITADMYTYPAGATGLDASMPPWVQAGGFQAWKKRLQDPAIRKKVIEEMLTPTKAWENLYLATGSPGKVLLVGFKQDSLKYLTGKTVAAVAALRGKSPEETVLDLVIQDDSRVGTVYFLMSEDNIKKQLKLPWLSFGSDAESLAPEGVFMKSSTHPRAYGNFARLLGKYVRDEQVLPLEEAIRKLTSLPAANLKIKQRGGLKPGYFADVVVFDPATIQDHATFDKPHQYSTGVVHVWVNGQQVLKEGEHTGAKPGRVVRGPGYKG